MMMSHMESNDLRWPNVRLGELGDMSAAFKNGFSDMMMNTLWVYVLEESQNHQLSGFPVQESSEYNTVSNPALSSSRLLVDVNQNRENDDPNSMKNTETVECKVTQKARQARDANGPSHGTSNQLLLWIFTGWLIIKGLLRANDRFPRSKRVKILETMISFRDSLVYASVFEMHEVDEEALPLLTIDDLTEMGVVAVGARRKLYAAICQLKGK
ncbi:putative sterile alpha motif domain-containing protein [Helianthus annuus]|uniref:Sterile alpha motif domain-containing protein n=1 Tax=Helianthus annuus TaxID=4232 RepID=A0A9K3I970_HELAN|nr:putative sterile alpha motif domain-containing protein [Helianthus annuus]KAJ0536280.1 putative sterile alpha motif domain-containing protein [Helianthus annuus]